MLEASTTETRSASTRSWASIFILAARSVAAASLGAFGIGLFRYLNTEDEAAASIVTTRDAENPITLLPDDDALDLVSITSTTSQLVQKSGVQHSSQLLSASSIPQIDHDISTSTQESRNIVAVSDAKSHVRSLSVVNPIPDQVINADLIYNFGIDAKQIFGENIQAVFVTSNVPAWMSTSYVTVGSYTARGTANDVKIVGTTAYVANGYSGLQIIDVADATNPIFLGSASMPAAATKMAVSGNVACVATGTAGVQIVDITQINSPKILSTYNPSSNPAYSPTSNILDVSVNGTFVYALDNTYLHVLDITNPSVPIPLTDNPAPSTEATSVFLANELAYVGAQQGVYSIQTKPPLIVALGNYTTSEGVNSVTVVGTIAYVGTDDSLQILDIANPAAPSFLSTYPTLGGVTNIAIMDGVAFLAESTNYGGSFNGLQILNITNPLSPSLLSNYTGGAYGVAIVGSIAFITENTDNGSNFNGLVIVNVTDSKKPNFLSRYLTQVNPVSLVIVGTIAYVVGSTNSINGFQGLEILNVANLRNPSFLGCYPIELPSSIEVVGGIAYVTARNGLQILNIADPGNPSLLRSYAATLVGNVVVIDSTAYVTTNYGLQVFNVANPATPSLLGTYTTLDVPVSLVIVDTTVYIVEIGDFFNGIEIFDVASLINVMLSNTHIIGTPIEIEVVGTTAYVTVNDWSDNLLKIFDVSNPTIPNLLGSYFISSGENLLDLAIVNTTAYVAKGNNNGLQIFDIANTKAIRLLGNYTTLGAVSSMVSVGNMMYLTEEGDFNGLQILDISDPTVPHALGLYQTLGRAVNIAIVNDVAFIVENSENFSGFQILNVSNPILPSLLSRYVTPADANDIAVVGTTAYVAYGDGSYFDNGLQILNVANLITPSLLGSHITPGLPQSMMVVGTTIFVGEAFSGFFGGLQVLNIANPTTLNLLVQYFFSEMQFNNVVVDNNIAYVTCLDSFKIFNIANNPIKGSYFTPIPTLDIAVSSTLIILAQGDNGLQLFDITDNSALPLPLTTVATAGSAQAVMLIDNIAYISEGTSGLEIFNVVNPTNPVLIGSSTLSGYANTLEIAGHHAYVASGSAGLQILDLLQAQLQGIPDLHSTGKNYTVTVTAIDNFGNIISDVFHIVVAKFPTVFQPVSPPAGLWQNKPFVFSIPANTFADPNYSNMQLTHIATLSDNSNLPAWLYFNNTVFSFSGTSPIANTWVIKLTATNPLGAFVSTTFPLTVNPNLPPTVANPISNQAAVVGTPFSYVVSDNTFSDIEGNPLTLSAMLAGGQPLPLWLQFHPPVFSGTPGGWDTNFYQNRELVVSLTAHDGQSAVTTTFNIIVSGTSYGQRAVNIASPIFSVATTLFAVYQKRALILNRWNKKKYKRLEEKAVIGEFYSRELETPVAKIAVVQATYKSEKAHCCRFFRNPKQPVPGGALLPPWLEYYPDTNTLRSRGHVPDDVKLETLLIQVKDTADVIHEQFELKVTHDREMTSMMDAEMMPEPVVVTVTDADVNPDANANLDVNVNLDPTNNVPSGSTRLLEMFSFSAEGQDALPALSALSPIEPGR